MFTSNRYIFVDPAARASIADGLLGFSRQAAQASQLNIFSTSEAFFVL